MSLQIILRAKKHQHIWRFAVAFMFCRIWCVVPQDSPGRRVPQVYPIKKDFSGVIIKTRFLSASYQQRFLNFEYLEWNALHNPVVLEQPLDHRNGLGRLRSLHFFTNNAMTVRTLCGQKMQCPLSAAVLAHTVMLQGLTVFQMNIFNNKNFGGGFQVAFFQTNFFGSGMGKNPKKPEQQSRHSNCV